MARQNNRLSALGLSSKERGFHPDGRGLYLSVAASGSRSWIFRYMLDGRSRDMGIGPYPGVNLASARLMAEEARSLCRRGIDPIDDRAAGRLAAKIEESRSISFKACAQLYFDANSDRLPRSGPVGMLV